MAKEHPKKIDLRNVQAPQVRRPPDDAASSPASPAKPPSGPPPEGEAGEPAASSEPKEVRNPLRRYSLRGKADEIEASAAATKPMLGKFVMRGQATMIYAEPNTGKTLVTVKLCLDAIDAKRIDPNHLYYINADDSSEGLAVKLRLMQDAGAHMLVPGFRGFRTDHLVTHLLEATENGAARDTCVVIDTLKKFTDLMDKKRSSAFAQGCRDYVMKGGTIVALGHTTKHGNTDGTPRYQGTTDIVEDFDAVYVAQPLTSKANEHHRVVKFTRKKCRADSPETVAYGYATDRGISYQEKVASVRPVDPDDLDDYTVENADVSDPLVMDAIVRLIEAGCADGQMALAKAAAKACGVSQRAALNVLNRYTGNTPKEHLWNFEKGQRGVRCYRLIEQAKRAH